jgi:hypothetical protein
MELARNTCFITFKNEKRGRGESSADLYKIYVKYLSIFRCFSITGTYLPEEEQIIGNGGGNMTEKAFVEKYEKSEKKRRRKEEKEKKEKWRKI